MNNWRTPQRSAVCCGTDRPFEEGERIFSVLRVTPEGLLREDFSEAFFDDREGATGEGEGAREGELVWWRTIHRVGRKRGLALDFEAIERLFDVLAGREEERLREMRYVACLLLMRKRRLKLVRVKRTAEEEAMIVRRPRRTEEHSVVVFDLTPERAATLREELLALFEGAELDPQEDPGAEAPEAQADPDPDPVVEAAPASDDG